jgi:hypothetical protein
LKVCLAIVLALFLNAVFASTLRTGSSEIRVQEDQGKWTWELLHQGKSLVQSDQFSTKSNAVRSAVALLANGGDKDRCKRGVVGTGSNGTVAGNTVPEGQEDVESEKQYIQLAKATGQVEW